MKTHMYKNIIFFIVISTSLFSQDLTDSYLNFGLAYGIRPFSSEISNVDFSINNNGIVESYPADINDDDTPKGLNISLGFGRYRGVSHQLFFDLPLGQPQLSKFGYNIGYNMAVDLGNQDLLIRPSIGISTGGGTYDLVNQDYNATALVFDTLNILGPVTYALKRNVISLSTGAEISYLINQNYAIQFQFHYDLEMFNSAQKINIDSNALEGPSPSYIFSDQINLSQNGTLINDKIIKYSGARISIGISQYINKQLFN